MDSSGNIYIADTGNHVIREVSNGIITTIAGNNTGGYAGMADQPWRRNFVSSGRGRGCRRQRLYRRFRQQCDPQDHQRNHQHRCRRRGNASIAKQSDERGCGQKLTTCISAIAMDCALSKFSPSNGTVTVLAGNGNIGFSGDFGPGPDAELDDPTGIAVDSKGYVYIATPTTAGFARFTTDGTITTIAGLGVPAYTGDGGDAVSASLSFRTELSWIVPGTCTFPIRDNNMIRC